MSNVTFGLARQVYLDSTVREEGSAVRTYAHTPGEHLHLGFSCWESCSMESGCKLSLSQFPNVELTPEEDAEWSKRVGLFSWKAFVTRQAALSCSDS